MKTKSTGSKKSSTKSTKVAKAQAVSKANKRNTPTTKRPKTTVALSTVKTTKKTPTVAAKSTSPKAKVVVAKVSVAERLSAARLVKTAPIVKGKSQKATLTLVPKGGTKLPATKISRSEPTDMNSKVITGRFSVDAPSAAPILAVKSAPEKTISITTAVQAIVFKAGDKIVYPGHGVGEIEGIRTTVLGGQEHHIYNIKILDSGMKVMVPVSQASAVGLRKIIDKKAIDEVFSILKDRDFKIDTQTWNRRFREYSQKIKTGSVFEIAIVLRDLSVLSADKELSFGEKKMLDMAESLLVSEIAIARARPHDKVAVELRELFA